jgi:hypothetical protein
MKNRALITVAVWVLAFVSLVTNGQVFTHAIIMLGACVVGSLPWFQLLRRQNEPRGRAVAIALVGISIAVAGAIAIDLATSYETQRRFNESASTPNPVLENETSGNPPRDE